MAITGDEESGLSTPIQSYIKYFNRVKPYHTKILEVLEQYSFTDRVSPSFIENLSVIIELVSPTPSPVVSPTITPTITPSPTVTPTPTAGVTPSPSPSLPVTPTSTAPSTPPVTPTSTPTATPPSTPAVTPSVTPTISVTPSVTATVTPSPTLGVSVTPTVTPSASESGMVALGAIPLSFSSFSPSVGGAFVRLRFQNNGTYDETQFETWPSFIKVPAGGGQWWSAEPVASIGDDYEIKVDLTLTDPNSTYSGPTDGVWTALTSDQIPQWTINGAFLTSSDDATISIRDTATMTIQDSMNVTINLDST